MFPKGQKRKSPPADEETSDSCGFEWESQRQVVFSMSMIKYRHSQELVEPNLRRVVLITNTLRQLDLQGCGDAQGGPETSDLPSVSESELQLTGSESDAAAGGSESPDCSSKTTGPSCDSGVAPPAGDEDWASMSTEPDFEVDTAIASILSALDSIDGNPCASSRPPLRSLENLSGGGASWEKQEPQAYFESWKQPSEASSAASGYLGEVTMEDLFQDIDTSLLETDMELLELKGGACGHPGGDELLRYLPPFSPSSDSFAIALNQNFKCLPAFSSFIPASSSSAALRREEFEVERLMQVLVES